MTLVDLEGSAARMSTLVGGISRAQLDAPTPCADYTVGGLLDHIDRFVLGFTSAATKADDEWALQSPAGDAAQLCAGWDARIPTNLTRLVSAWRVPSAYEGMTRAGGVDLPGEVAPVVALEELVVHGWDLARGSGQPFACDDASLETVSGFFAMFSGDNEAEMRGEAYAAPVGVGAAVPLLDQVVALSGRDPNWTA